MFDRIELVDYILMSEVKRKPKDDEPISDVSNTVVYNPTAQQYEAKFDMTLGTSHTINNIHDTFEVDLIKDKVAKQVIEFLYGDIRTEVLQLIFLLDEELGPENSFESPTMQKLSALADKLSY